MKKKKKTQNCKRQSHPRSVALFIVYKTTTIVSDTLEHLGLLLHLAYLTVCMKVLLTVRQQLVAYKHSHFSIFFFLFLFLFL
jgi:hypothetical protein